MIPGKPEGSALRGERLPLGGANGRCNHGPKMASDAPMIASGNGQGKTRLLTRDNLDKRTKASKQFDAIAEGIAQDLGGEDRLSTVQRHLVEAFAGAAVHVHDLRR
jgi:hypothetical protein